MKLKMSSRVVLLLFMCMVLMTGFVSAWDWDNVLLTEQTDSGYNKLIISDSFLGIPTTYVATLELIDDGSDCMMDCSAVINVTLYEDMSLFSDGFDIIDNKGHLKSSTMNIYYLVEDCKDVPVKVSYDTECGELNGYYQCYDVNQVFEKQEQCTYDWKKYKGEVMPIGDYQFRIESKKDPSQAVDWSFGMAGISKESIKEQWAWWNATWSAKKPIYGKVSARSTVADYQIFINVTYDNNMTTDFSDLRFTDALQTTELYYAIDTKVDGAWATVWVQLNQNLTTSNTTVAYMYYGNQTVVTSKSNNYTTFQFYDGFNTANTTKWTQTTGSLSVNGTLGLATVNNDMLNGDVAMGTGYAWETRHRRNTGADSGGSWNVDTDGGTDTSDILVVRSSSSGSVISFYTANDGAYGSNNWVGSYWTTYSVSTLAIINQSSVKGYLNNVLQKEITSNIANEPLYLGMRSWGGTDFYFDWVRIRGFTDATVTTSFGAEQDTAPDEPEIQLSAPANNTYSTTPTVDFYAYVTDEIGVATVNLIIDGVINETNSTGLNATNYSFTKTFGEGSYDWYMNATDVNDTFAVSETRILNVDLFNPTITANVLTPIIYAVGDNVTVNVTATDTFLDSCWYFLAGESPCYQESANITNQSGLDGNCGLNYGGYYQATLTSSLINITYEKPSVFAVYNATTRIKWGNSTSIGVYNYSIPQPCVDANDSYVNLRLRVIDDGFGAGGEYSNFSMDCYDGASWIMYANMVGKEGCTEENTTLIPYKFYDGNWSSANSITSLNYFWRSFNPCSMTVGIVEEAIIWEAEKNEFSCTTATPQNVNITSELDKTFITFYANDSAGKTASASASFTFDTSKPKITVSTPAVLQNYGYDGLNETFSVNFSDVNLDACWYNYNGTNVSFPCTSNYVNVTNITLNSHDTDVIFYANDTMGNTNQTTYDFDYVIYYINNTYSASESVGAYSTFTYDMYWLNETYTYINAYVNWNGVRKSIATQVENGNVVNFTSSFFLSGVTVDTNVTFYWEFDIDGTWYNSSMYNQTITSFKADNCTLYTVPLFNFTLYDEDTTTLLNATATNSSIKVDLTISTFDNVQILKNVTYIFTQVNPARLCLQNQLNQSQYRIDGVIQYTSSPRFIELYHFQNYSLTNSSDAVNFNLYNLLNTSGQVFQITYKDENFVPVNNAILDIQRKYVGTGQFLTVERPKTGKEGITVAHLVRNDVTYNILVYQEGRVVATFENIIASCQNPVITTCEINLNSYGSGGLVDDFTNYEDLVATLTYNQTTRTITSVFSVPSGVASLVELNVTLYDRLGTTEVCNDKTTGVSGTLTCVVPQSFGNSTVVAKLFKDGTPVTQGVMSARETPQSLYGDSIIVIAMIIFLFFVGYGATTDSPMTFGVVLVMGSLLLVALNVVYSPSIIGAGATILWFVVAVILLLIKGGMRE